MGDELILIIIDTQLPYLTVDLEEEVVDRLRDEGAPLGH